jgi:hypothetical protein
MFLPLKFQSKYGSSNELLMHFLVRERGPSDSLRGQEKWPQNAKSLLSAGGLCPGPQTPRRYICFCLFANFFLLLKLFLKTLIYKGQLLIKGTFSGSLHCPLYTALTAGGVMVMVFNATFNNISAILWQSVLLVEETRVPGKNHRPVTSR